MGQSKYSKTETKVYILDLLDRELLPLPFSFLRCCCCCPPPLLLPSFANKLLCLSGKRTPGPTSDARLDSSRTAARTASRVKRSSSSRFCFTVVLAAAVALAAEMAGAVFVVGDVGGDDRCDDDDTGCAGISDVMVPVTST